MFDATEQAFLDYLQQGHSRTGAAGWLGFTTDEFAERIEADDNLKRACKVAEAQAQFRLEQIHLDPDNKTSTRNTLTELSNRYPRDWGKAIPVRPGRDYDQPPEKEDNRLAPSIEEFFEMGNNIEPTDEPL